MNSAIAKANSCVSLHYRAPKGAEKGRSWHTPLAGGQVPMLALRLTRNGGFPPGGAMLGARLGNDCAVGRRIVQVAELKGEYA